MRAARRRFRRPVLHLPYGPGGSRTIAAGHPDLVGRSRRNYAGRPAALLFAQLRSSDGTGCPQDGTPVFSSIFAEDTIANSNYNSLQVSLEKRFSHGLQAQMAYTFSKSFDQASSFEGELNPLDPRGTYSLSQFDARHRLVLSYVWQLPIPKYSGFAGKVLSDWDVSGIYTYQSGFPIRITSSADNELMYSAFFEYPGEPNQLAPFHKTDPKDYGWLLVRSQQLHRECFRRQRTPMFCGCRRSIVTTRACLAGSETPGAPFAAARQSTTLTSRCTRCCRWWGGQAV